MFPGLLVYLSLAAAIILVAWRATRGMTLRWPRLCTRAFVVAFVLAPATVGCADVSIVPFSFVAVGAVMGFFTPDNCAPYTPFNLISFFPTFVVSLGAVHFFDRRNHDAQKLNRALKAIGISALSLGILLASATASLTAWRLHAYELAQAQRWSEQGWDVVQVENPYGSPFGSVLENSVIFLLTCMVAALWTATVILPIWLLARRLLSNAIARHLLAAAIVFGVSALTFANTQTPTEFIPPFIVFLTGGTIGLIGLWIVAVRLPTH